MLKPERTSWAWGNTDDMIKRRALVALLSLAVTVALLAVTAGRFGDRSNPMSSTASAERQYRHALEKLATIPRFAMDETILEPYRDQLGRTAVGRTEYHLLYIHPDRVQVTEDVAGSALEIGPLRLILIGRTLCVGDPDRETLTKDSGWVCSPTHPVSWPWYVHAYLLGGQVGDLQFVSFRPGEVSGADSGSTRAIGVLGTGHLGCTPARSGGGTQSGYHWCRRSDIPGSPQVTGVLILERRTGLPLTFRAVGPGNEGDVRESATFHVGGKFLIMKPRARRVPCLSWIPAVHCVELSKGMSLADRSPVALERVGAAPPPGQFGSNTIFHHGQMLQQFLDWPSQLTQREDFWFVYTNCPVTSRGAFRVTVYRSGYGIVDHGAVPRGKQTTLSVTLVDRRASDSARYWFPAPGKRFYFFKVEIPAPRGCAWKLSDGGN